MNGVTTCGPPPPALPAGPPRYTIPGAHLLDPAYVFFQNPGWPYPRQPWPFESETRAAGTGLIGGPTMAPPAPPALCGPAPASWFTPRRIRAESPLVWPPVQPERWRPRR